MENYKIIQDENLLRDFIKWLPDLEHEETFYLCLFARKKYAGELSSIKNDKAQLKRFTSNKERLFDKIRQLECPIGSYTQKGIMVPQEALALYITINPRSIIKATKESIRKLLDLALVPYNGYNPHQEVLSEIQRAKSKTRYAIFDFDVDKNIHDWENIYDQIDFLNIDAVKVLETRGGYHFIVEIDKIAKSSADKKWYTLMMELQSEYSSDVESKGDVMIPVVGTYQGGFIPNFKI